MGKASRRSTKGHGTRNAFRFVCGHCPGVKFQLHDYWNRAVYDWNDHNRIYHQPRYSWHNRGRVARGLREDSYQEIQGAVPVPAIVRELAA